MEIVGWVGYLVVVGIALGAVVQVFAGRGSLVRMRPMMVVGIAGSVVGGIVGSLVDDGIVTRLHPYAFIGGVVGAVLLLAVYRLVELLDSVP